jgi:hypothetical protein
MYVLMYALNVYTYIRVSLTTEVLASLILSDGIRRCREIYTHRPALLAATITCPPIMTHVSRGDLV